MERAAQGKYETLGKESLLEMIPQNTCGGQRNGAG
jgi:hypothetical protein